MGNFILTEKKTTNMAKGPGRPNTRQQTAKKAREAKASSEGEAKNSGGRPRGHVINPSNPPQDVLSQPVKEHGRCEACDQHIASPHRKRRKLLDSVFDMPGMIALPSNCERIWRAIAEARFVQGVFQGQKKHPKKRVSVGRVICGLARGVNLTERQFRRKISRGLAGKSLTRKSGSGRHSSVNLVAVEKWFEEVSDSLRGLWTVRFMVEKMKAEWGFGSNASVMAMIRHLNYKSAIRRLKPQLTEKNREQRMVWCQLHLMEEDPLGDENHIYIHVDEKWFYGVNPTKRAWVKQSSASGEQRINSIAVANKRFLNKVMFLAAVATPKPQRDFDGMIGFYGLVKSVRATRTSENRARGTPVINLVNMDKAKFIELLKEKVVKDALTKCPWATHFTIQMDNAGGHGGGKGDIAKNTLDQLNVWARDLPDEYRDLIDNPDSPPLIEFVAQPPHSPDLNVLDLGAWRSLDVAVDELKRNTMGRQLNCREIYKTAKDAWRSWAGVDKLNKLFFTLQMIWRCVVECDGGNMYSLPHRRDFKSTSTDHAD